MGIVGVGGDFVFNDTATTEIYALPLHAALRSGLDGSGQLATILRAAYANPAIQSICKTDGLAYRVSEIVDGVDQLLA